MMEGVDDGNGEGARVRVCVVVLLPTWLVRFAPPRASFAPCLVLLTCPVVVFRARAALAKSSRQSVVVTHGARRDVPCACVAAMTLVVLVFPFFLALAAGEGPERTEPFFCTSEALPPQSLS